MAKIDELNFQLILDDKKFNKQVKSDLKAAQDLNAQLSTLLNVKSRITGLTKSEYDSLSRAEKLEHKRRMDIEAEAKAVAARKLDEAREVEILQRSNGLHKTRNRFLSEAATLAGSYISIMGATKLVSNLVRVSSEFELQRTTLRAILQDVNGADRIFEQIKSLAVVSPFSFRELVTYTKQLSAYSVPIGELYETTKMLADVSAGLGVGMDRLVLAYGQVRSAAFLRGQEVRQFTEAGIPILDELAKQFGEIEGRLVSVGEVFDKISARQVPFEMVAKVFEDMTSAGGKFYQMQEIQAETLKGKLSNLTDAYEIMFSEIGEKMSPTMKGAVDWLRSLAENYESIGRTILELVVTYGVYNAALLATEVITKSFTLSNHKLLDSLVSVAKKLKGVILSNPYALLAAGATAAAYAIYKVIQAWTEESEMMRHYQRTIKDMEAAQASEIATLDTLYAKLKLAKQGTQEYDDARNAILSKYSDHIENLRREGVEVSNLANIYSNLRTEVLAAAQERFMTTAMENADEDFAKKTEDLYKRFSAAFEKGWKGTVGGPKGIKNATALQKEAIWQWITGVKKSDEVRNLLPAGWLGFFDWIRKDFSAASKEYSQIVSDVTAAHRQLSGEIKKSTDLPKFVDIVQGILGPKDKNSFKGIWADEYTQYNDYLETLKKRYSELGQQIQLAGNAQADYVQGYKNEMDVIRRIAKALDLPTSTNVYDYVTGKSESHGGGRTEKSPEQIRIERQIELVKQLREAYEQLSPYISDERMAGTLSNIFSESINDEAEQNIVNAMHYEEKLVELAKELAKYDPEASARLLLSIGTDGAKDLVTEYKNAYDQMKAYADFMNAWKAKDFEVEGSGILVDLSKVASDLNTKLNDIESRSQKAKELLKKAQAGDKDAIESVKETYGQQFWDDFVVRGEAAIDELADKERAAARTISQEKVNDLAKKYVSEGYFLNNIDLKEFGDKTIFQLDKMRQRLQAFLDKEPLTISADFQAIVNGAGIDTTKLYATNANGAVTSDVDIDAFVDSLTEAQKKEFETEIATLRLMKATQKAGIGFDDLSEAIKKVVSGDLANLTEEEGKAAMSLIKEYIGDFKQLFSAIDEYAAEAGNNGLSALANGFTEVMDVLMPIAERMMQGDWIGAIISGVTSLATKIFQAATAQQKLANAIEEAAANQRVLNAEMAISMGVDGVFGKDQYRELINAYDQAADAYKVCASDIAEATKKLGGGGGNDSNGLATGIGVAAGAGLGAAIGVWFFGVGALIGAAIGAAVGLVAGATIDIVNEVDNYTLTLQEMADKIGAPLLTEDGVFNKETLQKILDTYTDLNQESVNFIKNLIANVEIFEKSCDAVAETMTDIFGDVAESVADAFITAFKESGEAALDYADIIDNLATSIVRMVMKSALLQTIFDEDKAKEVARKLVSGDLTGAIGAVDEAMQEAQSLAPVFQEWLESMQGYFKMGSGESGTSLTEGMQALTESTGDLLASYLNAIRADVSYSKSQRDTIIGVVNRIASLLPSTPKLGDYLAKIQANTFDTAQATRDILLELRSVMTNDGGMTAIRAYM